MLRLLKHILGVGGQQMQMTPRNVILITGCDSGLGYALSIFCHSLNMTVVSACHNTQSEGSRRLQTLSPTNRLFTIELDLLKEQTILTTRHKIDELLNTNRDYEFTALVNNAGVMCIGQYEWQTSQQIELQINVNLLGTMRLTKEFLPLVRQHKGRIINITSHCGLHALPAFATYAATKAGLRYWNDALRIEMRQYGVKVINFVPGSLVTSTNISARQPQHAREMLEAFTTEQRRFYASYFHHFNQYLQVITGFKAPDQVRDEQLLEKFKDALTNTQPAALYRHEPLRYKLYHMLFQICPTGLADWLTTRFCAMPTYASVSAANLEETIK